MNNKNHLIIFFLFLSFVIVVKEAHGNSKKQTHNLKINCSSPDSAGSITGNNVVCHGETKTYSVPAINLATGYYWTVPIGAKIVSGANTRTITVSFKDSSGNITVYGTNTCLPGAASSIFVTVNSLPKLTLIAPQKYCCDYGTIALGSSQFASPTGGIWSCRQNPTYINSNSFITPQACNPAKPGIFSLIYTYTDPSTGCINRDSTRFTINPLPAIKFVGGTVCQSAEKIRLKPYIKVPINLNALAEVQFKLLKSLPKAGGGVCKISDLLSDEDPTLNYDYWLTVSKKVIDLGAKTKDSIILELTIQDGTGCYNKDTATFILINDPEITFDGFPELCINAGKVNLTKISNTKPENGCWSAIDTTGFKSKSILLPGMNGCDSLNTFKLNQQKGPGLYWMSYVHTASGCPVRKDTFLRIYPLPNLNIGINPTGDKGKFCETDGDVKLNASPTGGTWTSSVSGIIIGNVFKPNLVTASDRDKWITLTYYYKNSLSKCDTAKSLQVFVQSKPLLDIMTPDIDTCWRRLTNLKLAAKSYFTSNITWFHNFNPLKASFDNKQQSSSGNPVIYSIIPPKDSVISILITAITDNEGVCPFALDTIRIRIDSIQCKDTSLSVFDMNTKAPFDFSLFPNPNKGKFNIEINRNGNYSFKLYSIDGKLILEKNMEVLQVEMINQKLSKGNYTIVIEDKDGNFIRKKIMVE